MKHVTGFLIRRHRLMQNLSQEGLCKGICAASYLSKIEQGHAEPGDDIIAQLFAALGIRYENDAAFLAEMRHMLRWYFDAVFHEEDAAAFASAIDANAQRLENSELYIDYHLFRVSREISLSPKAAETALLALQPFEQHMDEEQEFLYRLLQGMVLPSLEAQLAAVLRAKVLMPCSIAFEVEMKAFFTRGKYQEALAAAAQGFPIAAEEGNIHMMRAFSHLQALCYANLFNKALMLRSFERAKALSRGDTMYQAYINYNIGATLLEMHEREEALPLLLEAESLLQGGTRDAFLCCHKLAILLHEEGRIAEGRPFLEKAEDIAKGLDVFSQKMIAVVSLRYAGAYEKDEQYLALLQAVYEMADSEASFGYKQFHGLYLMEAYIHRRKYKEALAVSMEIHKPIS